MVDTLRLNIRLLCIIKIKKLIADIKTKKKCRVIHFFAHRCLSVRYIDDLPKINEQFVIKYEQLSNIELKIILDFIKTEKYLTY